MIDQQAQPPIGVGRQLRVGPTRGRSCGLIGVVRADQGLAWLGGGATGDWSPALPSDRARSLATVGIIATDHCCYSILITNFLYI